jgi:polysaccharide deacetylase family protein (PEP-CTERM system associated)
MGQTDDQRTLLLSVDFEDWHQLVRRRIGVPGWEQPGPAVPRQVEALLALLDELDVHATFFVLGMAARSHPGALEAVVARGHEIACHGDAHLPVHAQSAREFAADLRAARATIEELTGRVPVGYRAPAFSITRECPWALDVLMDEGFSYDASQHDTPRVRRRLASSIGAPHPLQLNGGTLWEFPVAVWRGRRVRIPVGGASYWATMPTTLVLRGLREAGPMAGLYLHPQELDPEPLRTLLPPSASPSQRAHGVLRAAQRNLARRRAADVLRALAGRHRLITYGDAHAKLSGGTAASP